MVISGLATTPVSGGDWLHGRERQVTSGPTNHVLTNANVWSHDSRWIYFDVRSDAAGAAFDGQRIERVEVSSGHTQTMFHASRGAYVGVVTAAPHTDMIVFIHGPEDPSEDWKYSAWHRRGVLVDAELPLTAVSLDARDLTPPYTPGALRGGSHVHTFSPDGSWIAFTYEDHVLAEADRDQPHELNQREVGVSVPADFLPSESVVVNSTHPRNHDGTYFSVLVSRTHDEPRAGSDEICRACEDAWIGRDGYLRSDGRRQRRAIAFQGEVIAADGRHFNEVYVVDMPNDLTRPGDQPLEGTPTTRPYPPRGVVQRRLTNTGGRKFAGIQGPRHWLRSSPDGDRIACLMKDDAGVVQIWTVSPRSGELQQLSHNIHDIASAFTWSPDGQWITHVMDTSVCVTSTSTGETYRLTPVCPEAVAPRPEACVFSPAGDQIAYVRRVANTDASGKSQAYNQVFILTLSTDIE